MTGGNIAQWTGPLRVIRESLYKDEIDAQRGNLHGEFASIDKTWWDFGGNVIYSATLTRENGDEVLENLMKAVEAKCRPDQVLSSELIAAVTYMVEIFIPPTVSFELKGE